MTQYDVPINANDASFERVVLKPPLPVVAVFWSPKIVPRQQISDVLEQVAGEYAGEVLVVKLDVADAPEAQGRYSAGILPQFLFFRRGKLVARAKGMPNVEMVLPPGKVGRAGQGHAQRGDVAPVDRVFAGARTKARAQRAAAGASAGERRLSVDCDGR
jgi:thioredoxin 1